MLALAYDREAAPSLQGFIDQLREGDVEIKRDMEQGRDEVRIMTVHGAKGLQAPIVFLPDTCMPPRLQGVRLYPLPRAGEPTRRGRPSHLAAGRPFEARRHRRQQGCGGRAERGGISPAALCRHDARRGPALYLRLGRTSESASRASLVRPRQGRACRASAGAWRGRRDRCRRMESASDGGREGRECEPERRDVPPLPDLGVHPGAA